VRSSSGGNGGNKSVIGTVGSKTSGKITGSTFFASMKHLAAMQSDKRAVVVMTLYRPGAISGPRETDNRANTSANEGCGPSCSRGLGMT